MLQPAPCTHPSAGCHSWMVLPCLSTLAGFSAHLSVYFPHVTPCHVFKHNLHAGGLLPLPPSPTSHHYPCSTSPAERLWRYMTYFGTFDKGKYNKHLNYLLPGIVICHYKVTPIRKHLSNVSGNPIEQIHHCPKRCYGAYALQTPMGQMLLLLKITIRKTMLHMT